MVRKTCLILAALSGMSLLAADPSWKDKAVTEWSDGDAQQLLGDSPWAKSVEPKFERQSGGMRGSPVGIGRRGGIGMGGRGGGLGRAPRQSAPGTLPNVIVRWESALPIQEAQLKMRNADAPTVSEDSYTIAVLGLPSKIVGADPDVLAAQLKHAGELKREGKKSIRSSEARVLPRDDGLIILFLFPRSQEITPNDKAIEFKTRIGAVEIERGFDLPEMIYAGKLAL